jgi:hypothetical protein
MKIIAQINLICKDEQNPNGYLYAVLSKEYNTTLIPMNGMEFEDPVWKKPRIIQNITICPEENYYVLFILPQKSRQFLKNFNSFCGFNILSHFSKDFNILIFRFIVF